MLVCTFGAGGVGLTMTASDTVILLDRPWTPGDAAQAEDRIRRIGQEKPVTSVWLQANDLDTKVDAMLEKKQGNVDIVINSNGAGGSKGGVASADGEVESTSSMIQTVLREMLGISAPAADSAREDSDSSGKKKPSKGKKARRRSTRLHTAPANSDDENSREINALDASALLSPEIERQYGSRNRNSRTPGS